MEASRRKHTGIYYKNRMPKGTSNREAKAVAIRDITESNFFNKTYIAQEAAVLRELMETPLIIDPLNI